MANATLHTQAESDGLGGRRGRSTHDFLDIEVGEKGLPAQAAQLSMVKGQPAHLVVVAVAAHQRLQQRVAQLLVSSHVDGCGCFLWGAGRSLFREGVGGDALRGCPNAKTLT